ncbi:hypothetical protein D3C78_1011670 [compost metagenome]
MQRPAFDEEHIGAGGFGDVAAPVEHQRIVVTRVLGVVLAQRGDLVMPGGLGLERAAAGWRAAPARGFQADAGHARRRVEIARPLPAGDGHVHTVEARRGGDHFTAAPGHRAQITLDHLVALQQFMARRFQFGQLIGDGKIHQVRRAVQPLTVLAQLEDPAVVDPLAFIHGARVMQAMGQHMQLRPGPLDELAVEPDNALALIKRDTAHIHISPLFMNFPTPFPATRVSIPARR